MIESISAFLLILFISSVIYIITRRLACKTLVSEEKGSMYACGEKTHAKKLLVNVTLYKYLIFFVILDSPALILAFAALALEIVNPLHLLLYLSIILAADFLLLGGHDNA